MYYSAFVTGRGLPKLGIHEMKRVLLIEDDRDIVELVRYNLEREGFQVASRPTAPAASRKSAKRRRTFYCST